MPPNNPMNPSPPTHSLAQRAIQAVLVPLTSWWQLFAECVGGFALGALAGSVVAAVLGFGFPLLRRPWDPTLLVCAGGLTLATRRHWAPPLTAVVGLCGVIAVQAALLPGGLVQSLIGRGDALDRQFADHIHAWAVALPGALVAAAWSGVRASRPDLFPPGSLPSRRAS